MKKIVCFLLLASIIIIYSGCLKTNDPCTPKSVQSEEAQIMSYASANGITAIKHSSGIYYQIINPGSGVTPGATSRIFVRYTGKLTNGTVFDQQSDHTKTGWALNSLIAGWQIGVPLIQKGGSIKLIIPSSLGYGCQANSSIPGDSILYFEIELVDVQ